MGYKYVMFGVETRTIARSVPVIFPDLLVHSVVAAAMRVVLCDAHPGARVRVLSAGSVEGLDVDSVSGASETLGAEACAEDATVINMLPYLHGVRDEGEKT